MPVFVRKIFCSLTVLVMLIYLQRAAYAQEVNVYPDTLNPNTFNLDETFSVSGVAVSDNATVTDVDSQLDTFTGTWLPCTLDNEQSTATHDTTLQQGTGISSTTRVVAIQDDGKLILGGDFASYNGNSSSRIVRIESDGTYDSTFSVGTGFNTGSIVSDVVIQSDGKILVGGTFTTYNGTTVNGLVRLNTDGTRDTGFAGSSTALVVNDIELFDDGKILVGGSFLTYSGTTSVNVAKLNTDGTLDTDFPVGLGFGGTQSQVRTLEIFDDNKIIVGGRFTNYQGVSSIRVAKLKADATLDTSFSSGTGPFGAFVYDVKILDTGKILIGGDFSTYNGTNARAIARLEANGSIDTSFDTTVGVAGGASTVFAIAALDDDKIIIGGNFTTYDGNAATRIARINSDGSFDSSLGFGSLLNNSIFGMTLIDESQMYLAGLYSNFNSSGLNFFGRFNYRYSGDFSCSFSTTGLSSGTHTIYFRTADEDSNTITSDYPSTIFYMLSPATANVFKKDTKCRWSKPPALTWIKITPVAGGINVTWTQYDANKVSIYIDDGNSRFLWEVSKTLNDGKEFLPNVHTSQSIKLQAFNGCRSGDVSQAISLAEYPNGWYSSE